MQIFLNEVSIHQQYHSQEDFSKAIKILYSILLQFKRLEIEKIIFWSESFCNNLAINNDSIIKCLSNMTDKSFRTEVFNILYNKLNIKYWETERTHLAKDSYNYSNKLVTDTSMAELAERKLLKTDLLGLLLNLDNSKFSNFKETEVTKNKIDKSVLDCIDTKENFTNWICDKISPDCFGYDTSSNLPPSDLQTILKDGQRFRKTSLPKQGGRTVFEESNTRYNWYVDSFHTGDSAHIEVFDRQGNHIGEANLLGVIDTSKNDSRKKLRN